MDRRQFLKEGYRYTQYAAALSSLGQLGCSFQSFEKLTSRGEFKTIEAIKSYEISRVGEIMSDGQLVPGLHDGMACFDGTPVEAKYVLVRNHELEHLSLFDHELGSKAWDTSARGGTTTIWLDDEFKVKNHFTSLAGTVRNCSGGVSPWNTWISCEEYVDNKNPLRKNKHGYAFEVNPYAKTLKNPKPLTHLGRFKREGVAFSDNGIVYQTEDEDISYLYRFVPKAPGKIYEPGRLQAMKVGGDMKASWVDLDPDKFPLSKEAKQKGCRSFANLEGILAIGDNVIFSASKDGENKKGVIYKYEPDTTETGRLSTVFKSTPEVTLNNPDQMTFNKWGDLMVCEDAGAGSRIFGLRPDGGIYLIAENPHSEWTGICFSPDQKTLFANIQRIGLTVAMTGDWEKIRNVKWHETKKQASKT